MITSTVTVQVTTRQITSTVTVQVTGREIMSTVMVQVTGRRIMSTVTVQVTVSDNHKVDRRCCLIYGHSHYKHKG